MLIYKYQSFFIPEDTNCLPFVVTWVHPNIFWWDPCSSSF